MSESYTNMPEKLDGFRVEIDPESERAAQRVDTARNLRPLQVFVHPPCENGGER
jgi:hypothetical protein